MRILANFVGYPTQAEYHFHVTMVDPCASTALVIDPSILISTAIDYIINDSPWVEVLDDTLGAKVTTTPDVSSAGCPSIFFSFLDVNTATTPDTTIFSYVPSTLSLSTSSSDFAGAGLFNLKLIANFDEYSNTGELDFTVTLHDCRPVSVISSVSTPTIADIEYTIGDEQIEVTFNEFELDIETNGCLYTWTYKADLSDSNPLPTSYITFDDSTRTFIISAASGNAQSLEVRLSGQLYGGNPSISNDITFKLEIIETAVPYYHVINHSPSFLNDITMHLNSILFIEDGSKQIIYLGQVVDAEDDDIMIMYTST